MEKVRVNMYLPQVIVDEIERGCARTGLNRTEYIVHVMLNHFDQQRTLEMARAIEEMKFHKGLGA